MASDHRHSPYPDASSRHSSSKTPRSASAEPSTSKKKKKNSTAVVLDPDTERVTIDPRGDVILALKWEDEDPEKPPAEPMKSELRVSSSVLSLASPVFAVLFSDRFSEGQALRANVLQGESLRIALPEDHPAAMKLLCLLLHHQYDDSNEPPSQELLCRLGLACHKYDCAKTFVIQRAADSWLEPLRFDLDECSDDLIRTLITVWLFELPKIFRRVAMSVVLCMDHRNFRTNFVRLVQESGYDLELPSGFFAAFSNAKIDVLEILHLCLYHITDSVVGRSPPKQCQLHSLYSWISSLQDSKLRNTPRVGLDSWKKPSMILRSLNNFEPKIPTPELGCGDPCHRCNYPIAYNNVGQLCQIVRRAAETMCLECIKSEKDCSTCTHK